MQCTDPFIGVDIKDDEAREITEEHSDHGASRRERHRKIGSKVSRLPGRNLPSGSHIDDRDLACVGNVDEGAVLIGGPAESLPDGREVVCGGLEMLGPHAGV